MRKKWLNVLMALLISLVAFSAQGRQQSSRKKQKDSNSLLARNAIANSELQRAATAGPSYVIGAEDMLRISVWKEPEITQSVLVRPDGKISLPLLHDVQASGLTPMQLASVITEKLREYVADPQVTVTIAEINSQRIYVIGAVLRAGAYPLLPNMTVLQALASAGGFTEFADVKKIFVLRTEGGRQVEFPFNYKEVIGRNRPEGNVLLKAGDTIIVR